MANKKNESVCLTLAEQLALADILTRHGWMLYSPDQLMTARNYSEKSYVRVEMFAQDAERGDKSALFEILSQLYFNLQRPIAAHFPDPAREFLLRIIKTSMAPAMRAKAVNAKDRFEKISFALKVKRGGQLKPASRELERHAIALEAKADMTIKERLAAIQVHRELLQGNSEAIDDKTYRDIVKRARERERRHRDISTKMPRAID